MNKFIFFFLFVFCIKSFGETTPLIVTSFSLLQDITQKIVGPQFEVRSLINIEQEAHSFEPKPETMKQIKKSQVFIVNGLGFDSWTENLVKNLSYKGLVLVASKSVQPLTRGAFPDPHAWQNPLNGILYGEAIKDQLSVLWPQHQSLFEKNFKVFKSELEKIHQNNLVLLKPYKNFKAITFHEAFNYFANLYGFQIKALQGVRAEQEVRPQQMKLLIQSLKQEKPQAFLDEKMHQSAILEELAKNYQLVIGEPLYSDSLSDSSGPASDYYSFLRYNAKTVDQAFKKAKNKIP